MKYFSPRCLLGFSISVWLILSLIAPMKYNIQISPKAFMYLIISIFMFYMGTFLYDFVFIAFLRKSGKERGVIVHSAKINKAYNLISILATIGIILRFVDLFYLKAYLSYGSIANFRVGYSETAPNIISILSAILFPLCIILLLISINYKDNLSKGKILYALLATGAVVTYTILRGGRTTITLVMLMMLVSAVVSGRFKNFGLKKFIIGLKIKKESMNIILGFIGIILAFFIYSVRILIDRLNVMGFTVETHLKYMEYIRHITIKEYIWDVVQGNEFVGYIVYTIISLEHYFLHGFYEFMLLFKHFNANNVAYGAFQFYPVWKLMEMINLTNIDKSYLNSIVVTKGVYTTFWGPVLTDFGLFGFLYCFILGIIAEGSWLMAIRKKNMHLLLYPYVASVILHSPFLNMIQSGMGLYILFAIILGGIIFKITNSRMLCK